MMFILLARLTDEGRQRMYDNPEMLNEVCDEVRVPETQMLARYAVLGRYDFVLIAEAPDTQTVARLSLELGARARLQIETLPAMAIGQLTEPMEEERRVEPSFRAEPRDR